MDKYESKLNLEFTYSFDKYSCVQEMWYYHIALAYVIGISGFACMLTRLVPSWKWTHVWWGRIYVIAMLWCTGTSMLIHNDGLPVAVLVAFFWVLMGLSLGWIAINFHQIQLKSLVEKSLDKKIKADNGIMGNITFSELLKVETTNILNNRTFVQRFVSFKSLHGIMMVSSWGSIVGRLFASNQSGDFTCHTYPTYKQVSFPQSGGDNPGNLTFVPTHDPRFERLPWSDGPYVWAIRNIITTIFMCMIVGAISSYLSYRRAPKAIARSTSSTGLANMEQDDAGTRMDSSKVI